MQAVLLGRIPGWGLLHYRRIGSGYARALHACLAQVVALA